MTQELELGLLQRVTELERALATLRGDRRADADRLQGRRIQDLRPADADVLKWNNSNNRFEPEAPSTAVAHTFDSVHHTDVATIGEVQGDVIYFNGSNWTALPFGVSGQFLKTQGAGANPVWAAGGAPTGAQYVVIALDGTLTAERRLQVAKPLRLTDGGANGDVTLNQLQPNWGDTEGFF